MVLDQMVMYKSVYNQKAKTQTKGTKGEEKNV